MFSRSTARTLARNLSSPLTSLRPSPLPLASLSRAYTGISSRSSIQTLVHLTLEGAEDSPDGIHTITSVTDKSLGDRVEEGEILGYIEHTIRTEIVAPCSGNLQKVLFADGEQVDVGDDLFVLSQAEDDEDEGVEGSYASSLSPLSYEHDEEEDDDEDRLASYEDDSEHEDDEEDRLALEEEEDEDAFEKDSEQADEPADPFEKEPDGEERKREL